jgi:hypothetical protein
MSSTRRPVTVLVLSCLYITVGAIGFAYHLRELMALQQVIMHSLFLAVIARLLFRPDVRRYFRSEKTTVSGGGSAE